jgi:DNA-binding CsgD family transcriptional regulator
MSIHYALELLSVNRGNYKYIIRTPSNANNRFLKALLKRDLCNSLLFYKKEKHIIKMYSFIATRSDAAALTHLINNQPLIESVTGSYGTELENIFKKAKYLPLRQNLFKRSLANDIFNYDEHKVKAGSSHGLTLKELEYVQLLAHGATNKELAVKFKITPRAACYKVKNIKKKLKIANRSDIIKISKVI